LGYRFSDRRYLQQALTHRSFIFENSDPGIPSYERLEFLGDALIGFIVSAWLFEEDPSADEGALTRRRQSVVRTEALAEAAVNLGLGDELRLGRGEESTAGRQKSSLLADAFEAVVAAIYLDGGLRPAKAFVRRHLKHKVRRTRTIERDFEDHKTRLQEVLQARYRRAPGYRTVAAKGPPHALVFEAEVLLGSDVLGFGVGRSRKQAEQAAARDALERLAQG
jgi:ribonuclease-3